MNKKTGFTLIEMMIIMTIIAILISGLSFFIEKKQRDYRLKNAASDLYFDLQTAKSMAVLTHEPVQVIFNTDEESYQIQSLGSDGIEGGTGTATDKTIKTVNFSSYGSGVKFGKGCASTTVPGDQFDNTKDIVSYGGHRALFQINGIVNIIGYVYLTNNQEDLSFAVGTPTHAGIIRILKTTGKNWMID